MPSDAAPGATWSTSAVASDRSRCEGLRLFFEGQVVRGSGFRYRDDAGRK